jgi:hypothetical protein
MLACMMDSRVIMPPACQPHIHKSLTALLLALLSCGLTVSVHRKRLVKSYVSGLIQSLRPEAPACEWHHQAVPSLATDEQLHECSKKVTHNLGFLFSLIQCL